MSAEHARALRLLRVLLGVAVLVSIVHYVDNVVNYADYPVPTSGPAPSRVLVGASWFLFTGFGLAGLVLFARGRVRPAALCLAAYSGSGLVGFGHYTVPGAIHMAWWRQLHIVLDIACGIAVLAFALWAVRSERLRPAPGAPPAPRPQGRTKVSGSGPLR